MSMITFNNLLVLTESMLNYLTCRVLPPVESKSDDFCGDVQKVCPLSYAMKCEYNMV